MSPTKWMDKEDVVHIYTVEYYLAIKKEWNWVICIDVDESRACNTERSKKEKNKYHVLMRVYGI